MRVELPIGAKGNILIGEGADESTDTMRCVLMRGEVRLCAKNSIAVRVGADDSIGTVNRLYNFSKCWASATKQMTSSKNKKEGIAHPGSKYLTCCTTEANGVRRLAGVRRCKRK